MIQLGAKDNDIWPVADNRLNLDKQIKIAIQINGKTREIIEVKKDLDEKNVITESKKSKKIYAQLQKSEIQKIIFVKNKIINFLTKQI